MTGRTRRSRQAPASAPTAGGDRSLLRRVNAAAALKRLRLGGPATIAQVADAVGVSRTAAQQIINELIDLRWVLEDTKIEITPPRLGPAPRYYRFRAEAGYVVGVDVARHRVTAMLGDLNGTVVASSHTAVDIDTPAEELLTAIRSVIETCLADAKVKATQLWTASIGPRGVVHDGRVVYVGRSPRWAGLNLADAVAQLVDRPVVIDNDCNLAAVGEHWVGTAQHVDDAVYVKAGRHLGVGIMINGRLLRGFGGYAGELHHLPFLSWRAAGDQLKRDLGQDADIKSIFDAAGEGDVAAQAAVDRYARALSEGIAAIAAVVDPELIVLGGGVSAGSHTLLDPVRRHVKDLTARTPQIELSTLGTDAVALGAIRIGLNHVDTLIAKATDMRGDLPPPQWRALSGRAAGRKHP